MFVIFYMVFCTSFRLFRIQRSSAHVFAHIRTHIRTHTNTDTRTRTHVHAHAHMHKQSRTYTNAYAQARAWARMHVRHCHQKSADIALWKARNNIKPLVINHVSHVNCQTVILLKANWYLTFMIPWAFVISSN